MVHEQTTDGEKLLILWTQEDKEVAAKMVFMYAENSMKNGWWREVVLLIWGPSSKLVTEDKEMQNGIRSLQNIGVRTIACKQCAESYDVVSKLEEQDIEVFYTGKFLSDWLKSDSSILTV